MKEERSTERESNDEQLKVRFEKKGMAEERKWNDPLSRISVHAEREKVMMTPE
jgi:hypothetical protein